MRKSWKPLLALLATNLLPAQINPKIWNLITPDDKLVCGVDLDRYRHSAAGAATSDTGPAVAANARYMITIDGDPQKNRHVMLFLGFTPPNPPFASDVAMLDATTAIVADDDTVRDSLARWRSEAPLSDLAVEARKLAESDDAWFVVAKPLSLAGPSTSQNTPPKHLADVIDVIEQASGGVRFGPYYQAHLEVRAKTADDAYSLAALGRWLPGLLQAMHPDQRQSRLIDLAENVTVQAIGRTATLSFSIAEDKLADTLKSFQTIIEQ